MGLQTTKLLLARRVDALSTNDIPYNRYHLAILARERTNHIVEYLITSSTYLQLEVYSDPEGDTLSNANMDTAHNATQLQDRFLEILGERIRSADLGSISTGVCGVILPGFKQHVISVNSHLPMKSDRPLPCYRSFYCRTPPEGSPLWNQIECIELRFDVRG